MKNDSGVLRPEGSPSPAQRARAEPQLGREEGKSYTVAVTKHLFPRPATPKSSSVPRAGAPARTRACRAGAGRSPRPHPAAPSSLLVWTRFGRRICCPWATEVERMGGSSQGPKESHEGPYAPVPARPEEEPGKGWGDRPEVGAPLPCEMKGNGRRMCRLLLPRSVPGRFRHLRAK